ncbi:DUF7342 family protein [Halovivax gelatinilyticus]|uniref:DUF7342 family protein n=1 Tax=Halovivax gelatinilyticus TaxID=2961597 RepID=UPI0020CA77AA|nr:hypothetical protein [Halovivax gelatinilyticus]
MDDADRDGNSTVLERQTTGEDRVRMVARQLTEPRTANWVASEAGWSHEPTRRVLERLVDVGTLRRDDTGSNVTYVTDYRQQAITEATRLRDGDRSVEELTERLAEFSDRIDEWKSEFDVESPNELRATVGDARPEKERSRRREVAREWDVLRRRIEIARFAIREWDFLAPATNCASADR